MIGELMGSFNSFFWSVLLSVLQRSNSILFSNSDMEEWTMCWLEDWSCSERWLACRRVLASRAMCPTPVKQLDIFTFIRYVHLYRLRHSPLLHIDSKNLWICFTSCLTGLHAQTWKENARWDKPSFQFELTAQPKIVTPHWAETSQQAVIWRGWWKSDSTWMDTEKSRFRGGGHGTHTGMQFWEDESSKYHLLFSIEPSSYAWSGFIHLNPRSQCQHACVL